MKFPFRVLIPVSLVCSPAAFAKSNSNDPASAAMKRTRTDAAQQAYKLRSKLATQVIREPELSFAST